MIMTRVVAETTLSKGELGGLRIQLVADAGAAVGIARCHGTIRV